MFFLATADADGRPTCSYKGGDPGFVRVVDDRTLAFPNYDGNGMYLSMGNVAANPEVGLLFLDFVKGTPVAGARTGGGPSRRPAGGRLPRRPVRRPGPGQPGVPQLPALHPPLRTGRAVDVRAPSRPAPRRCRTGNARTGRATTSPRTIPPARHLREPRALTRSNPDVAAGRSRDRGSAAAPRARGRRGARPHHPQGSPHKKPATC